ncbi:MAG TPA: FAD-dependent monooxygenase [Streptosporangiaceae bacterium]
MLPGIAVVGAGIAGLALAAALDRHGLPALVFEQAAEPAEVGAGVQLAPNATRLLHRLGLAERLGEIAVRPAATEFRRWADDHVIARTVLGEECERQYGAPYYTIHRADLRDALASLVRTERVYLGRRVVAVRETADGAVLSFADGSRHSACLVAGADGIRSVARQALAADEPVFSGLGVYRGLVPATEVPELAAEPAVRLWLGPGSHLVCYPVQAGRLVSFAATVPCPVPGTESWTAEGTARDLRHAFRNWSPTVRRIVDGAPSVRHWGLYDRGPLRRLSTSRVVLVGDAAHPMLPFAAQGANQAIEDAMALAACLARPGTGAVRARIPEAAGRYRECRGPRTARLQQQARWNIGGMHLPDGAAQRSRDVGLAASADLHRQAWLYGHDAEGECLP